MPFFLSLGLWELCRLKGFTNFVQAKVLIFYEHVHNMILSIKIMSYNQVSRHFLLADLFFIFILVKYICYVDRAYF